MKFSPTGYTSSQEVITETDLQKINYVDLKFVTYNKMWDLFVNQPKELDKDKRTILEIEWAYVVLYKKDRLIEISETQRFYVTEIEIESTDKELHEFIIKSHQRFSSTFDEKRNRFKVLPQMESIPPDTIEQLAQQFQAKLLAELKK